MDLTAVLDAPHPAVEVFAWVEDLDRYPSWLSIVPTARTTEPAPDDPGPAWLVDLRGRLGPFARSKRLRMVRAAHEPPRRVRFVRCEVDGRHHAPWVLQADVEPTAVGCRLEMTLHYGGSLWLPVVERILRDEIERSRSRLLRQLAELR